MTSTTTHRTQTPRRRAGDFGLLLLPLWLLACADTSMDASLNGPRVGGPLPTPTPTPAPELDNPEDPALTMAPEATAPYTNPFVEAARDPFSTFAADVDTASYDIFRRDALAARLPLQETVRIEEFVNYFHYAYPLPSDAGAHPFDVGLELTEDPLGRGTMLLRVGIQAADPLADQGSVGPAHIVFLADVSGSMQSAEKLPLVQRVMHRTLDELEPDSMVSIVTYASGTGVALSPTPLTERATIEDAIDGLRAGGSTNGAGGLELAYMQAEAARADGINHVVLMTDGDFNVGPSSNEALVALIEEKRRTGITLTALGFGASGFNDQMLELVSNAGNGIYGVITDPEQADTYVADRMLSTLVHVARDVKLQVEFNAEHVLAYRLLGYENRDVADRDFRVDSVDGGEIGAGHQVTALYEIVPVGGSVPQPAGAPALTEGQSVDLPREVGDGELVRVKIRYGLPDAAEAPAHEVAFALPADTATTLDRATGSSRWAIAVAALAEWLRGSPYAQREQLDAVRAIVTADAFGDPKREEFARLLEAIDPLL